MVSLATAGLRFNSIMQTDAGFPFSGTIEPAEEGDMPSYDFSVPRLILRVSRDCPVMTGATIVDVADRRYLLGDHDVSFAYNVIEHRTHRLFAMTDQVSWERGTTVTDTLTNLQKATGKTPLGNIWVLLERQERQFADNTLRVKEDIRRIITGTELQLGDLVDGSVVKRIDSVLGVWLAEIQ